VLQLQHKHAACHAAHGFAAQPKNRQEMNITLNTLMAQCCPAVANSSCFTLPSNNAMRVACIFEASRNGVATAVYHTPAKPCREEAVSTMITSEPSITSSAQQVVTAKHTLQHSGATWCSSGAHNPQIYPRLSTQDPAASGWGHQKGASVSVAVAC
jgi:hypothetical protein